jgi:hypothetical protein
MKNDLFDSDQKKTDAISAFESLMAHPGWILIEQIEDANIEFLRTQLESEAEDEKLEDVKIIRNNLRLTREFRNTPKDMIKKLSTEEEDAPNSDPYDTTETLDKGK